MTEQYAKERSDFSELPEPYLSTNVCSATDCTGLMPSPPSSEAELESYEEMYRFCVAHPSAHPIKKECPQLKSSS